MFYYLADKKELEKLQKSDTVTGFVYASSKSVTFSL